MKANLEGDGENGSPLSFPEGKYFGPDSRFRMHPATDKIFGSAQTAMEDSAPFKFSLEVEVSVVAELGMLPGFAIAGGAVGRFLGVDALFELDCRWNPPIIDNGDGTYENTFTLEALQGLIQEPWELMKTFGFGLRVDLKNLPYNLNLLFAGRVSETVFELEAAASFDLPKLTKEDGSPYTVAGEFSVEVTQVQNQVGETEDGEALFGTPSWSLSLIAYVELDLPIIGYSAASVQFGKPPDDAGTNTESRGATDVGKFAGDMNWGDVDVFAEVNTKVPPPLFPSMPHPSLLPPSPTFSHLLRA